LIRPDAVRIVDSRALEQTVCAVAALFEEDTVLYWEPFFFRALSLRFDKKALIKKVVVRSVLCQTGLTVAVVLSGRLQASP